MNYDKQNKLKEILVEERYACDEKEATDILEGNYAGEYVNREAYCRDFVEDTLGHDLSKFPFNYIDWEYMARDFFDVAQDVYEIRLGGVSHVFHSL